MIVVWISLAVAAVVAAIVGFLRFAVALVESEKPDCDRNRPPKEDS